jgi:hypothetical protein
MEDGHGEGRSARAEATLIALPNHRWVFLKGDSKLTYHEATPGPPIHDLFSTRGMPFTMAMSSVLPITLLAPSPSSRPGARAALLGCL